MSTNFNSEACGRSPSVTPHSSRWKAIALGLMLILVGLVIWDGADRRAVDGTQPLAENSTSLKTRDRPHTLKLGSFNIHSGKGRDGIQSLSRTSEVINDVDFVGLYEVRATSEAGQPNQAASLARSLDAAWLFAPTERQWWSDHFGNGLIHRVPLRSVVRIPLINTRHKAFRNAILSTVELDQATVRIIAVHVDREQDRGHQLQTVIELFLGLQEPCVLMGDLNTSATDPILTSLIEHRGVHSPLHETSTDVSGLSKNIDWVFTRGLTTISASLVENTASDHLFLKAELTPTQPDPALIEPRP